MNKCKECNSPLLRKSKNIIHFACGSSARANDTIITSQTSLCQFIKYRVAELEREIKSWQETAEQAQRNCDYYHNLVIRCGEYLGAPAYTCDDGSKSLDVLCDKVPELVKCLCDKCI